MAFMWALRGVLVGAAGVGAARVAAAISPANTPTCKIIHVANDTLEAIFVVIENKSSKNESIIEAGERKEFTVSDVKPTFIKVRKYMKSTYDTELTIYEHNNFTVEKATTGHLVLVAAHSTKDKQNESGKGRKGGWYPHGHPNQSTTSRENPFYDRSGDSNHYY